MEQHSFGLKIFYIYFINATAYIISSILIYLRYLENTTLVLASMIKKLINNDNVTIKPTKW